MTHPWLLLINLVSTWYMVGLIWMVQIVHYRLFDRVGREAFVRYETDHAQLITPIVGVPMLIELVTAILLLASPPPGTSRWLLTAALAAVVMIWLSTALIQVPCHNRLAQGFNPTDHALLVGSNWIRTILWSIRGVLLTYAAARLMTPADASP